MDIFQMVKIFHPRIKATHSNVSRLCCKEEVIYLLITNKIFTCHVSWLLKTHDMKD